MKGHNKAKNKFYKKGPRKPAFRDNKTYKEVIEEVIKENRDKQEEIAFSTTTRLVENKEMVDYLNRVVVTELSEVISNDAICERVLKVCPYTVRIINLVASKFLIALETLEELEEVKKEISPLGNISGHKKLE